MSDAPAQNDARAERRERLLASYAVAPPRRGRDGRFLAFLAACVLLALVAGAGLRAAAPPGPPRTAVPVTPARFQVVPAVHLPRPPAPAQPAPREESPAVAVPRNAPVTLPAAAPSRETPPASSAEPAAAAEGAASAAPPRKVYGVRKIYGRALGDDTGGAFLTAKPGNSTGGPMDSLVARPEDLVANAVPLSGVDRAPLPLYVERPVYTQAMVDARASGVVNARLLVNVRGEVEQVDVLDDFGFDSARLAAEACGRFRFEPALRQGEPVAVWILYKIRFEFAG